jgi:hypothetical protein
LENDGKPIKNCSGGNNTHLSYQTREWIMIKKIATNIDILKDVEVTIPLWQLWRKILFYWKFKEEVLLKQQELRKLEDARLAESGENSTGINDDNEWDTDDGGEIFGGGRGLKPRPCIYYALSLPTELSSRRRRWRWNC